MTSLCICKLESFISKGNKLDPLQKYLFAEYMNSVLCHLERWMLTHKLTINIAIIFSQFISRDKSQLNICKGYFPQTETSILKIASWIYTKFFISDFSNFLFRENMRRIPTVYKWETNNTFLLCIILNMNRLHATDL